MKSLCFTGTAEKISSKDMNEVTLNLLKKINRSKNLSSTGDQGGKIIHFCFGTQAMGASIR
jgi:hypothetical protein